MDVNLLSKLLRELIIDNERIPLSGMGHFTTEPIPAFFSEDGKTIFPPSRKIHFKGDERTESDMIWKFYSKEYGIDENIAKQEVETFMKQLLLTFLNKKSIELPGLGRLICANNGEYLFINESDGGIFSSAFGFEPVTLRPSNRQDTDLPEQEEVNTSYINDENILPEEMSLIPVKSARSCSNEQTPKQSQHDNKQLPDNPTVQDTNHDGKKKFPRWAVILLITLVILSSIAIAFILNPEILDKLLYTPEELQIMKDVGF